MEKRRLGPAGPDVSLVGLGCNNFGTRIEPDRVTAVVQAALEAGITHFDTAESYGNGQSESLLGKALGKRRDAAIIATKFAPRPSGERYRPGLLRRRILEACDGSLERLGTDRIDIYYQHRPDPEAPIEESLAALAELIAAGKVMCVACSNFSAEQIAEAARVAAAEGLPVFAASQIHWNLLYREEEEAHIPTARRHHMSIVPYFPLESGLLTGKYRLDEYPEGSRLVRWPRFGDLASEESFAYIERLREYAEERGHSLIELAFGWLAAQEGVASVIAGATTPDQVFHNVRAGQAWRLTPQEIADLPARVQAG